MRIEQLLPPEQTPQYPVCIGGSPGYLPALKAALVRGRFFTEDDDGTKPGVAVINESLARKFFPGEDPVGQKIANDEGGRDTEWEIVGGRGRADAEGQSQDGDGCEALIAAKLAQSIADVPAKLST